jgi:ParB family chromosome partitioning protein
VAKKTFKGTIKKDSGHIPTVSEEDEQVARARTKPIRKAKLIPVSEIVPDPNQPRKKFDQEKLHELADSIRSVGIIEPLTVRFLENDSRYQIVTGERRFKAAQLADLEEIPCIVKELTDQEATTYQLIENLQTEELSPIEQANGIKTLTDNGFTQSEVAKRIGKSQPFVSQILKILELPPNILKEAEQNPTVSKEHLLQLVNSKNPEELWKEIKKGKTAREIKEEVQKEKPSMEKPKPWTWKPEDKSFTVAIKFKTSDFNKDQIIKALEHTLKELKKEQ